LWDEALEDTETDTELRGASEVWNALVAGGESFGADRSGILCIAGQKGFFVMHRPVRNLRPSLT
jgi:hypothetical protein